MIEYPAASLWELDLAWATTVHKAQGGESPDRHPDASSRPSKFVDPTPPLHRLLFIPPTITIHKAQPPGLPSLANSISSSKLMRLVYVLPQFFTSFSKGGEMCDMLVNESSSHTDVVLSFVMIPLSLKYGRPNERRSKFHKDYETFHPLPSVNCLGL